MNKTILIAGKDFLSASLYAASALDSGYKVLITVSPSAEDTVQVATVSDNVIGCPWHRHSPISARSLMLQGENSFGKIDSAILIFDAAEYMQEFSGLEPASFSRAVDEMVLGYGYLAGELMRYFMQQKSGTLVFLLKDEPPAAVPNISVSVSMGAFVALAESIAHSSEINSPFRTVLIRGYENSDEDICRWLYSFIESLPVKSVARWYKIGAKNGGVFSFFR